MIAKAGGGVCSWVRVLTPLVPSPAPSVSFMMAMMMMVLPRPAPPAEAAAAAVAAAVAVTAAPAAPALAARAALRALILGWKPGVLRLSTQNYPPQDQIAVVLPAVLVSTVVAKMPTSAIQEASAYDVAFADTDVVGA